ncbi:MAG: YdiU family protein, partial [Tissierellales bacterium]
YAGHQYGNFTMLGDGRAVLLSEQITPQGKRFDIQLKGAGKTPFSRGGDGRAALGPMLREYIISEAMNALDIPTTRSLAVLTTGEMVRRERDHLGAILTRVAASHIRVGTFEYIAEWGTVEELKELADYTIKRHYPDIEFTENKYLSLLQEVIRCQASLISKWQLVGFIHGVMNTDNMTISGETIDYGPCAFMDEYNPATVFSSIDIYGRYAYGNQPDIAAWNLARLAETLLPLIHPNQEEAIKIAQDTISGFYDLYRTYWLSGMKAKLGIYEEGLEDESLIEELLDIMKKYKADYTNTFRALTLDELKDSDLFVSMEFTQWYDMWQKRLKSQKGNICPHELMMKSNPSVIPRNHRVEEALDAAIKQENYSLMERLLDVISNPFDYSFEHDQYTIPPEPTLKPYQTYCGT